MRKIVLIAAAVLATTSAHAELSGATVASAAATPVAQPAAAVVQPTPAAPAAVQAAPAVPILQTTNPQAQMVLKQLQAHGLIEMQPQPATPPAPATSANVVTLPAQGQVAQGQATQTQPVQTQATQGQATQGQATPAQPDTTASQQPVNQAVATPAAPSVSASKPVVHVTSHRDTDEAKARRIAARYGIHW